MSALGGVPRAGAIRIVPSSYWPRVFHHNDEVRLPGHPLTKALSRGLARLGIKFDPDVTIRKPIYRDADVLLDNVNGVIYCSHAQEAWLRQWIARQP